MRPTKEQLAEWKRGMFSHYSARLEQAQALSKLFNTSETGVTNEN